MPPFTPKPGAGQAAFVILPKGEYTFRVGEPKAFFKAGDDSKNKAANHGVRFPLEVVASPDNPSQVGKKISYAGYMHTDGSIGVTKRFVMAARGYNPNSADDEERFNDDVVEENASYDADANMVGDYWLRTKGTLVNGILDTQPGQQDPTKQQQQFKAWKVTA
jgi:hypothetical protein